MLSYDKTTDNMTLGANITNYNYITQTSGNNSIVIDDGTNGSTISNNKIVFSVGGKQETITIPRGTYTSDQLAAAIQTEMNNAAPAGNSYTVAFDPNANKFTIGANASNTGTLTLDWSNTGSTAGQLLGYNSTDESGAVTIGAGNNNTIVYNDNGGVAADNMTATIAAGTYTSGAALATAIQTALNTAVGAGTKVTDFSVKYDASTNKFSISTPTGSADNAATIEWGSGSVNAAQLGFSGASTTVNAGGGAGTATSASSVTLEGKSDNTVVANYYSFNNNYLNDKYILRALNFEQQSLQNNDSGRVQQSIKYTTDLSAAVSQVQAQVGSAEDKLNTQTSYQTNSQTDMQVFLSDDQDFESGFDRQRFVAAGNRAPGAADCYN